MNAEQVVITLEANGLLHLHHSKGLEQASVVKILQQLLKMLETGEEPTIQ